MDGKGWCWEYVQRTQPPLKLGGTTRVGNFLVVIWFLQIAPSKRWFESLKMLNESSTSWWSWSPSRISTTLARVLEIEHANKMAIETKCILADTINDNPRDLEREATIC